jgi:uncharacterized iron-regulated protein
MGPVKSCTICDSEISAYYAFCPFCGAKQAGPPHIEQPSYQEVFEQPFRRLELRDNLKKLDCLLHALNDMDEELSAMLAR